jgi:uncharacterized protein YdeI (YjbR/CyaY-like superfamily)
MRQAGIDAVEKAKQNGSWELLDQVEELLVPDDLAEAFAQNPEAEAFYSSLSRSARKMILHWVTFAKRAETRDKRVAEVVNRTSQNLKPPYS